MNRRNFLTRIGAVTTGLVLFPKLSFSKTVTPSKTPRQILDAIKKDMHQASEDILFEPNTEANRVYLKQSIDKRLTQYRDTGLVKDYHVSVISNPTSVRFHPRSNVIEAVVMIQFHDAPHVFRELRMMIGTLETMFMDNSVDLSD